MVDELDWNEIRENECSFDSLPIADGCKGRMRVLNVVTVVTVTVYST